MKIITLKDYEKVSKQVSSMLIKDIISNPKITLGLATGETPLGVYDRLINAYQEGIISFKDIVTFNLDEYIGLPKNHSHSYYHFMQEKLFKHVDIKNENIHFPNNDLKHQKAHCHDYNNKLKSNPIDVQLLGIGSNGHIGFNEPFTPLDNETFITKLDDQTREDNARFFESIDDVPTHAITMGIKNIMRANKIILMASGKNKAEAIYKTIHGDIDPSIPASILQLHPNCIIVIDEDAASLLNQ